MAREKNITTYTTMEKDVLRFDNLEKAMQGFVENLCTMYKELLLRDNKKASGELIRSIKAKTIRINAGMMIGEISLASYWKYVENGRKPGKWPPFDKILKWIEVKPVLPRPRNNAKPPTNEQLAFLISRKIGEEGIKPGNQMNEAIDKVWMAWKPKIEDAINQDIDASLGLILLSLVKKS